MCIFMLYVVHSKTLITYATNSWRIQIAVTYKHSVNPTKEALLYVKFSFESSALFQTNHWGTSF